MQVQTLTDIFSTSPGIDLPLPGTLEQCAMESPSRIVIVQTVRAEEANLQSLEVGHEVLERHPEQILVRIPKPLSEAFTEVFNRYSVSSLHTVARYAKLTV